MSVSVALVMQHAVRMRLILLSCASYPAVEASWHVMAHAQKPDFVFRRNGRVHLNRWGRQFRRLLEAELCASAVVMLDTPCSEVVWRAPTPFASFPFASPPVRHRVPSHFSWSLQCFHTLTRERYDFRNKVIEHKMCFDFLHNLRPKRFSS